MSTPTKIELSTTSGRVDFGRPVLAVRGPLSLRVEVRTLVVTVVLAVAAIAVFVVSLGVGELEVSPERVILTLLGEGTKAEALVIQDLRMPRALLALVLGAALGVSGAIFQSVTRNPLGSPDIIGFNTGAYTGALIVILVINSGGYYATAAGALVGGITTAILVYLLGFKRGVQGFRLIIVGIAISAILTSVNTWLILKASVDGAMAAAVWGAGSLNSINWTLATPVLIAMAVVTVPLVFVSRRLSVLEMGDDIAAALGLQTERVRLVLIVLGAGLTALATAAAGPIVFVSLASPQLAKRLARSAGTTLAASAAMGALLLSVSDLIARLAFGDRNLPVGIVTVSIGGLFLIWLLYREARRQ